MSSTVQLTLRAHHAPYHSIALSVPGEILNDGPTLGSTLELTINDQSTRWTIEAVDSATTNPQSNEPSH